MIWGAVLAQYLLWRSLTQDSTASRSNKYRKQNDPTVAPGLSMTRCFLAGKLAVSVFARWRIMIGTALVSDL